MSRNEYHGQGPNYVPAYQASGTPFVTSSNGSTVDTTPVCIKFPYVTRFFQVTNTSSEVMRIGFSHAGVQGTGASVSGSAHETVADHKNYFLVSGSGGQGAGNTVRLELRCKELWIRAEGNPVGFSLIAGMTGIHHTQFPNLTGSNGFQGIG
jgi:hypothetical protein